MNSSLSVAGSLHKPVGACKLPGMNEVEFILKLEAIMGIFTASLGRLAVIIDANTARIVELGGQHDNALAELRIEVAMVCSRLCALESSSERLSPPEPACEAPTPTDCLAEQLGRHETG